MAGWMIWSDCYERPSLSSTGSWLSIFKRDWQIFLLNSLSPPIQLRYYLYCHISCTQSAWNWLLKGFGEKCYLLIMLESCWYKVLSQQLSICLKHYLISPSQQIKVCMTRGKDTYRENIRIHMTVKQADMEALHSCVRILFLTFFFFLKTIPNHIFKLKKIKSGTELNNYSISSNHYPPMEFSPPIPPQLSF